jgi:hypothetical protein
MNSYNKTAEEAAKDIRNVSFEEKKCKQALGIKVVGSFSRTVTNKVPPIASAPFQGRPISRAAALAKNSNREWSPSMTYWNVASGHRMGHPGTSCVFLCYLLKEMAEVYPKPGPHQPFWNFSEPCLCLGAGSQGKEVKCCH